MQCGFEPGDLTKEGCQFIPDVTSVFRWTLHAGPTETEETGPMEDHTPGSIEGMDDIHTAACFLV